MAEETSSTALARMLYLSGVGTRDYSFELAYSILTILEDSGWVLVRKED